MPCPPPMARHRATSCGATGEFLARASCAWSQIGTVPAFGLGAPVLPKVKGGPAGCFEASHCASSCAANGELRARASFARSQIDMAGAGVVDCTLPRAFPEVSLRGAPQIRPSASTQVPARPWTPTATMPAGQACGAPTKVPTSVLPGPSKSADGSAGGVCAATAWPQKR